jgi:hypothetical protein
MEALRVFAINQVETMLVVAHPRERGMVAMAIFGGIHPHELEQMSAGSVDLERRVIHLPKKARPNGQYYVLSDRGNEQEGALACLPSVLFEWLQAFPFEPHRWGPIKARLADSIGFWIKNGCRETAIANYAAVHGIGAALALLKYRGDPFGANIACQSASNPRHFYKTSHNSPVLSQFLPEFVPHVILYR